MSPRERQIKVISYEGSSYKTDFWEGQGREFEDMTEHAALRHLLPPTGRTLIEIGAGFGRLADIYSGYEQVILLDYSLSLLAEAKKVFGQNPKYTFIAANVYHLPIVDNLADAIVMIRVAHHLEAVPAAFSEIYRVLQGGKSFILEYANKRNAKAIARYFLKKQTWSPFDKAPYEFTAMNFDFHPQWMSEMIQKSGFRTEKELALSNFRLNAIKNNISPHALAKIDNAIAGPGAILKLSPSVLTKNTSLKQQGAISGRFQCPKCGSVHLARSETAVTCSECASLWPIYDGIIDFRYPQHEEE